MFLNVGFAVFGNPCWVTVEIDLIFALNKDLLRDIDEKRGRISQVTETCLLWEELCRATIGFGHGRLVEVNLTELDLVATSLVLCVTGMLIALFEGETAHLFDELLDGVGHELVETVELVTHETFLFEESANDIPAIFLRDLFRVFIFIFVFCPFAGAVGVVVCGSVQVIDINGTLIESVFHVLVVSNRVRHDCCCKRSPSVTGSKVVRKKRGEMSEAEASAVTEYDADLRMLVQQQAS